MPQALPANPGKTLPPEFLQRAEAALNEGAPAEAGTPGAGTERTTQPPPRRRAATPNQEQHSRADAFSDAEDLANASNESPHLGTLDEQQPEGDLPAQDWADDGDVQEMAAYYGLGPEDLAAFPDKESFVAAVEESDRRNLLSGRTPPQGPNPQQHPQQQQPPVNGQKPNGQQTHKLPDEILEEALNAEYLDEEQTKTALRAIRDDNRMLRQVLFGLMQNQAQERHAAESSKFQEIVESLDVADLAKGDLEQVQETVTMMRQIAAQNTGRTPALTKSLVERAIHITFPKVQQQQLRRTLESQSRRRLGTTVSSRGSAVPPGPEQEEAEFSRTFRSKWTQFQRENGNL